MKTILAFGNPLVKEDSLAIEIAKDLQIPGYEFKICSSINDLLNFKGSELIILDVIENIKKTALIKNIVEIKLNKSVTAHDFDLAFNLKLMKSLGKINKIKIIGIPQKGNKEEIKNGIRTFLK